MAHQEEDTDRLSIPRIDSTTLSYDEFFQKYMLVNQPVLITNISREWECVKKWLKISPPSIDFEYLKSHLADRQVPVANCSKQHFNSHEKSEISLHKYLDWWKGFVDSNHNPETAGDLLYLKDWHLQKEEGDSCTFYTVPEYFKSDWLNEYLMAKKKDDYRFVYMGPKGSWTPFHSDVYSSFSWSTNIVGRKRWIFLPFGEEQKLLDNNRRLPFSIDPEDLKRRDITFCELFQGPNEAVFVPSGWFHQVWNLEDTISVNHNWFNGTQVEKIWNALRINLSYVIEELDSWEDVQGSEEHYQVMLKASFGMNFSDFIDILEFIFDKRLCEIDQLPSKSSSAGLNYVLFDLERIHNLVELMLEEEEIFSAGDQERLDQIKVTTYQ